MISYKTTEQKLSNKNKVKNKIRRIKNNNKIIKWNNKIIIKIK